MAPLQIRIIEQLVRKISAASDNPFKRRRLLRLLVEDHEGYALPPWILEEEDGLLEIIAEEEKGAGRLPEGRRPA
jgi:hypothetical protein